MILLKVEVIMVISGYFRKLLTIPYVTNPGFSALERRKANQIISLV